MNYIKLYDTFINYCLTTSPSFRMIKRNKNDYRLKKSYIYTENHHIHPKHDNQNTTDELVELLPEEHIFAHQVRWKAYHQRGDMLAVRFCLNGFEYNKNEHIQEAKMETKINKAIKQGYIWVKQNAAEVRKTHGWQSADGRKRISEARKGTMPARDQNTGELVGNVPTDHPKVLSGEWAHHTKGTKLSKEEAMKRAMPGEKNGMYLNITDDEIIEYYLELTHELNRIPTMNVLRKHVQEKYERKIPTSFTKFRFPNKSPQKIVEDITKLVYNPHFRTKEQRAKLSKANLGKTRNKNVKN